MNIQKLNNAIEILKRDLGQSLLATDVWAISDANSIAGFNTQPVACALFNEVTLNLVNSLKNSGFPGLDQYYLLQLKDGHLVVALYFEDYQWGLLIDNNKVTLGLLLNEVIPNAIEAFEEALKN